MRLAKDSFRHRYTDALSSGRQAQADALNMSARTSAPLVPLHDFMSQIVDHGDNDPEKRSIYFRLLERLIRPIPTPPKSTCSGLALTAVNQVDRGKTDITLFDRTGQTGLTAAGSAAARDP